MRERRASLALLVRKFGNLSTNTQRDSNQTKSSESSDRVNEGKPVNKVNLRSQVKLVTQVSHAGD